jgi:hypothetical protein
MIKGRGGSQIGNLTPNHKPIEIKGQMKSNWGVLFTVDINHIFKLPIEGIVVPMQEVYNEEWLKYFEGGKEKHYK